jgi:Mg/Co/Ni transporter MgtE
MKITGLDELARKMDELEKALAELDGDLAHVNFDPHDPESIEQAIHQLNAAVDEKIARYGHNQMVMTIADEMKENGRNAILERAAAARLEQDQEK